MISRLLMILLLSCPALAYSHSLSDSFINLTLGNDRVSGHWLIAISDLELAVGIDRNLDTQVTWGEIQQRRAAIIDYALPRLQLSRGDTECPLLAGELQIEQRHTGVFLHLPISSDCQGDGEINIGYDLLFSIDASHRGILSVTHDEMTQVRLFSPAQTSHQLDISRPAGMLSNLWTFLIEGIWHIWIGLDHILFLCALIIPIMIGRQAQQHNQRILTTDARPHLFVDILKVVTAFTIAHSITLILATLQIVALPSRLVESVIALSVAITGLNVLFPIFRGHSWQIAFGFGLIHGFGFAGVLGDLALPTNLFITSLLSFNVGVEVGQLVIVALLVPALWLLDRTALTRRLTQIGAGLMITGFGLLWLAERAWPALSA